MNDPKFSCYMVICNFAGGILHGGCTLVAKTRYPAFIFKSAFCLATFTPIHKANHKHKPLNMLIHIVILWQKLGIMGVFVNGGICKDMVKGPL